jgi:hypothetical protein
LYELIEKYCQEHPELIVSNIAKLLNKEVKIETDWEFNIYCENPYKYAISLTNLISTDIDKWVKMNTIITHQEFTIEYDLRRMISIYSLEIGKHNKLNDIINPVTIQNINYMSPEIELIDIYKKLYSPDMYGQWKALLDIELNLFDLVKNRSETLGGAEIINKPIKRRKKYNIENFKLIILKEYCTKPHVVLLGHWAMNTAKSVEYTKDVEIHVEKLQVISNSTLKDIEYIKKIIRVETGHEDLLITHKIHSLHLPKDFRIKRCTLYLSSHELKEVPFMDIFNSTEFELIPYYNLNLTDCIFGVSHPKSIKIANSYVLLRYIMIDLWILRVINKIGQINKESLLHKIRSLFSLILEIKKADISIFKNVFGIDYIGTNIDYVTAKKLEQLKSKHYPYIPILARKYNKYRIIH